MAERDRGGGFPMAACIAAPGPVAVAVAPALPGVVAHEVSSTFMPDVRFIAIDGLPLADGPPVVPAHAGMRMTGGAWLTSRGRVASVVTNRRTADGRQKVADRAGRRAMASCRAASTSARLPITAIGAS